MGTTVRYTRHRVIRFTPQDQKQFELVQKLQTDPQQIDIWHRSAGIGWPLDISGSAVDLIPVLETFSKVGMHADTLINDVQVYIDAQMESNQGVSGADDDFDYSKYHKIEEIEQWVKDITQEYSNISKMITITKSFEGREMLAIQISAPGNSTSQRPAAFIEGGIHAREWISPATVIYMASQMLENYGKDKEVTAALEAFDWFIVPVVNVDGYAYTWDKERLWRKTRTKHILCYGSDPNRNWDNHWCNGESGPGGRNPCSDTYCGPNAFSEPVVKGVADFILSKPKGTFKIFIDFHSYSQLWMTPFGWTKDLPADYNQQEASSKAATEAITDVHGTKYVYGPIATTIYLASGSSADWTYSNASVKYSYGVELRDTGEYGFLLPAEQIVPSGQETLQGLLTLADYVKNNTFQRPLTLVVQCFGLITRNYFVRFVFYLLLTVPCCFILPTLLGGMCFFITSIIYFVAAIKGEEWKPVLEDYKPSQGPTVIEPPRHPPPRHPPVPNPNRTSEI